MKQPQLQKLTTEEFAKQPWIEPLIRTLNQFMDEVVSGLNKNLTLEDNLAATIKTVDLDGTYPVKLAWTLNRRPQTVLVGNIQRTDGTSITLTSAVFVQWSFNQAGQLQIDNVVGLPVAASPTVKYKLTLEIKAG